jgi:hypothetical protein
MNKRSLIVSSVVFVFIIAGGSLVYYFAGSARDVQVDIGNEAQNEVAALVSTVGELIILPQGETPTIATVTDPNLLSEEAFFANAKKGDKVLIYTVARKAILYDPKEHKIIEVAPVNLGTPSNVPVTKTSQ